MTHTTHPHRLGLAKRELLNIPNVSGVRITCTEGSLWITLDHDPRDIVLETGEIFFSTEHRRALVYALEASALALQSTLSEPKVASAMEVRSKINVPPPPLRRHRYLEHAADD